MLDHLACDHDVRRLEAELGDGVRRLRVDDVRVEPVLARPLHAFLGDVEPDDGGGRVAQPLVQPAPALELVVHPLLIDEADVDDAPALRELDEHLLAVERTAAREASDAIPLREEPNLSQS